MGVSLATLPRNPIANLDNNDPDIFPGLIFADQFHSVHQGAFARGTPITTATNVCKLPRGKYAISPGDAATNKLLYAAGNSFPQGDMSMIIEWRPDRSGTVAINRYFFGNHNAADHNNYTGARILGNSEHIRFTHYSPAAVEARVDAPIIGGLVAGRLYRFLFVRDDDAGIETAYLAVYQWSGGAWVKISGALTGAFTARDAVPDPFRIGNYRTGTTACWGAYEVVCMKAAYDPTWDPTDAEAIADSTWAAVYRNGSLNADKTSGGDSATATNTGFVAVDLKSDALWQNRDAASNYTTISVPQALGVNRGAIVMDVTPLVLPAAYRYAFYEHGPGNNKLRLRPLAAILRLEFYSADNTWRAFNTGGVLAIGTRVRAGFLYTPEDIWAVVNGAASTSAGGSKKLRDGRSGSLIVASGFSCLVENIMVYDDAQPSDAWCSKELNYARNQHG